MTSNPTTLKKIPNVLLIGGLDPSGAAGITADVATVSNLGCHPAAIPTCLTVQDTGKVYGINPVDSELLREQCKIVLDDLRPPVIKIGLLPNQSIVETLAELFAGRREQIILDPVLMASSGDALTAEDITGTLRKLFPHCSLITPNLQELNALTGETDAERGMVKLQSAGIDWVLATDGDGNGNNSDSRIINRLRGQGIQQDFRIKRLAGQFRGTGCTLSSAIAAYLAQGKAMPTAVRLAQDFVAESLRNAYVAGYGPSIPNRLNPSSRR